MPKQCGPIQIIGTIDNVCFYKMDGVYYARMKSSLTRKRVLKSAAFRRTREHAATLGEASKIASRVYRLIPKGQREHILYREMTGKAIYLLREGKDKEAVFQKLNEIYSAAEPEQLITPAIEVVSEKDVMKEIRANNFFGYGLSIQKLKGDRINLGRAKRFLRGRRKRLMHEVIGRMSHAMGP